MKKNVLLLTSFLMVFFISCNNEDPSSQSTFSMQQKTVLRKSSIANKQGTSNALIGTLTFSKVLVGVSKIKFEKEFEMDDDENEEEMEYRGAYTFDVLNGTSTPAVLPIEMTPGLYHEIEFDVDNVLSSGNSIEISGTFNDGVSNYEFEFTSTMEEEYEIENENGIDLNVNEITNFVLFLELEGLFDRIDFSDVVVDEDNVIRINSNSNTDIASQIENNFEHIMEFEDDEHEDDDDN
ncbi:MAG: hypothetical protein L3J34_03000 [Flavobacteriaceae bacterium]|nr:hypothetical protein [Flavobacteriaceae bacterium]